MSPVALGAGIAVAAAGPAFATIDNAATARGSYGDQVVQSEASVLELPVEPARVALEVSQSVLLDVTGGDDAGNADGGDTLVVTLTVTNGGNVAVRDVRPAAAAVVAGGVAGTGRFAAARPERIAEIAPGASRAISLLYTLGDEDVYRVAGRDDALVVRIAATGAGPAGEVTVQADDAKVAVGANPRLSISKGAVIGKAAGNRGAGLEAGDLVTYTYTVTNTGNVPIDGITITDEHEGAVLNSAQVSSTKEGPFGETETVPDPLGVSEDASGPDGVWDVLGAGGAVTFTYRHTVTQAEFEAQ
ncbi:MAG: hypothetical protein Kow0026_02650 [Oricola sp.]